MLRSASRDLKKAAGAAKSALGDAAKHKNLVPGIVALLILVIVIAIIVKMGNRKKKKKAASSPPAAQPNYESPNLAGQILAAQEEAILAEEQAKSRIAAAQSASAAQAASPASPAGTVPVLPASTVAVGTQ